MNLVGLLAEIGLIISSYYGQFSLICVPNEGLIHNLPFQGGSFVVILFCLFWCQSFGGASPYVCSYNFSSVCVA